MLPVASWLIFTLHAMATINQTSHQYGLFPPPISSCPPNQPLDDSFLCTPPNHCCLLYVAPTINRALAMSTNSPCQTYTVPVSPTPPFPFFDVAVFDIDADNHEWLNWSTHHPLPTQLKLKIYSENSNILPLLIRLAELGYASVYLDQRYMEGPPTFVADYLFYRAIPTAK